MECHKTNSSLDTLLSLDYEEIKSEKLQNHSSFTSPILSCEEELKPKKHRRHYKSKCEHRRRSGEQRKKSTDSVRTNFITQEIHVERQNFKCIINLNTTVCDHKNSCQSCNAKSSKDLKSKLKERPVPHCLRQLCRRPRHHDMRFHRHSKEHYKADLHNRTGGLKNMHKCMVKTKHDHHRHRQRSRHQKKPSKEKNIPKQNESKIISPPKKQLELTYEDISATSLDSYLEVPTSYKHVAKNSREEQHESKLDTLIKRTKERERKLVEQSRNIPWYTSTPHTEVSSVDFPLSCSDVDVSIHSRSTLILEPRDHGYSPSIEGVYESPTFEKYFQYSPKLNIDDYLFPNMLQENDFELKIKTEPTMDIAAYSPTQSPDSKKFEIKEQWIKKEIKIEPNVD